MIDGDDNQDKRMICTVNLLVKLAEWQLPPPPPPPKSLFFGFMTFFLWVRGADEESKN